MSRICMQRTSNNMYCVTGIQSMRDQLAHANLYLRIVRSCVHWSRGDVHAGVHNTRLCFYAVYVMHIEGMRKTTWYIHVLQWPQRADVMFEHGPLRQMDPLWALEEH